MEPTQKSPGIESALERLLGGGPGSRRASIERNICVGCRKLATRFSDTASKREFAISGLCQECQDGVFGNPEQERAEDAADMLQDAAIFTEDN